MEIEISKLNELILYCEFMGRIDRETVNELQQFLMRIDKN